MSPFKNMSDFWHRRSLKFWLAMGMLMTFCPILFSAVTGYFLYHHTIIQPLVEVSSQQREILQPLQSVQIALWDVSNSLVDYAIDGKEQRDAAYHREADEIDAAFARILATVQSHRDEMRDVNKAWESWQEVNALSSDILSRGPLHGEPKVSQEVEELEARLNRLSHRLKTIYADVRVENDQTHNQALINLGRSEYLAASGFVASIVFAVLGVVIINRSLVNSMNALATGAMRLAGGDRNHHIKVQIPQELANVADAFNQMTNQILQQEEALSLAATTDGLTGLLNRRECDRILADEIQRGDRYGTPFSMIMGDIDHFKSFNDTYGHQVGDEVLRAVAEVLRDGVRGVDKVCRYGGEEFVMILPECDAVAARQTAERLRAAVEVRDFHLGDVVTAQVTMSLGVGTYHASGASLESFLKTVDGALYKSKESGRNQVTSAVAFQELKMCRQLPPADAPPLSTSAV
jgi:diguanylate cyclase (GGDEF)-like protein